VHYILNNKIILVCLYVLLQIYVSFISFSQNLNAEAFTQALSLNASEWTLDRLENYVENTIIARNDWAKIKVNKNTLKGFYQAERKSVLYLGIHHDGSPNSSLNSILTYHIKTNGWGDIAYHFIIDKKGQIYEGRSLTKASDTNNVFRSYGKERLSSIVNILLIGNFDAERIAPDSPQVESAKILLAYLYLKYPLVTLDNIRGHRDFITDSAYATSLITCPGKNMYSPVNIIDEIKSFVRLVAIHNTVVEY